MVVLIDIPLSESPKVIEKSGNRATIEITSLYPGYGVTLGNALRRVLLSSLPGAAVTVVAFRNVSHEFTTIPGIKESVLDISLNLKRLRLKSFSDEPQTLVLEKKGEGKALAKDIVAPAQVSIISEDLDIATLSGKKAELYLELTVERGVGYVPSEERNKEKMPIGNIAIDAIFSPVLEVDFTVENMRVGDRTDYNRLIFDIETDGTIAPEEALIGASSILVKQFSKLLPEGYQVGDDPADGVGALMGEPLAILGLTGSIVSKLEDAEVRTIGSLIKKTKNDITGLKGVGAKAVDGLIESLKKYELTLAGNEDEDEAEDVSK